MFGVSEMHCFQDPSFELGELIQKQNVIVREGDFPRLGVLPTSYERNI